MILIAVAWGVQKRILIFLLPLYLLCTGCPPKEPLRACDIQNDYVYVVADKYAFLYKKFVSDTIGAAWNDTIFQSAYPDSSAENRRLFLKRYTDSCSKVAADATVRLCELSNSFAEQERMRIQQIPFPWKLFFSEKRNPYEDEANQVSEQVNRVTDSVFLIAMDTAAIF